MQDWMGLLYPSTGAGSRRVYIVTSYSAHKARTELTKILSSALGIVLSTTPLLLLPPLVSFDWLSECIARGTLFEPLEPNHRVQSES